MNNICTSLEQSKKLIKLGIDIHTADMHHATWTILDKGEYIFSPNYEETIEELQENYGNQIIPTWSLSALMELMNRNCYNVSLNCHGAEWNIKFDDSEKYKDFTKDYPLDAAFEMVCWLLENDML